MKLYAEVPRFRNRQVAQDLALVAWVYVWIRIGIHVRALVDRLADPARRSSGPGAVSPEPSSTSAPR